MLPEAAILTSYTLLILRLIIGIIFFSSGMSHLQHPVERGKSIGMPPAVTGILGTLEIVAAISLAFGIFIQGGAAIIVFIMLGAIYKKVVVWKTGFFEKEGYGWHYDLLLLAVALVVFTTAGGKFVLY